MKNKKILYVSDYLLNFNNSVSDILNNIINIEYNDAKVESIIVKNNGYSFNKLKNDYIKGYKSYSRDTIEINEIIKANKIKDKFFILKSYLTRKFLSLLQKTLFKKYDLFAHYNIKYKKRIINKVKPDLIVFFTYNPDIKIAQYCARRNIKYVCILYDTLLERPGIDSKKIKSVEEKIINHSICYFVPNFFYSSYKNYYQTDKVISYKLPLLINKKSVLNGFNTTNVNSYEFTYFGQLQQFRNVERIKELFRMMNKKLDVFTYHIENDDVFNYHTSIEDDELYSAVAHSRFLVAFDNSAPFNHYLPSKVYLYVSFTKPIIAFGDNESSALKTFFKDYPYFYYQNINEPLDGLLNFINLNISNSFDDNIYNKFIKYDKDYALRELKEVICKTLYI